MKGRNCRVSGCVNGECRRCKRERAAKRDRALSNQRDIRAMVEAKGLTEVLQAEAAAIVATAIVEETFRGARFPDATWAAIDEMGMDVSSSASVQHYIETGLYLHKNEVLEWF